MDFRSHANSGHRHLRRALRAFEKRHFIVYTDPERFGSFLGLAWQKSFLINSSWPSQNFSGAQQAARFLRAWFASWFMALSKSSVTGPCLGHGNSTVGAPTAEEGIYPYSGLSWYAEK